MNVALVIAGVLGVIGVLFAFFGVSVYRKLLAMAGMFLGGPIGAVVAYQFDLAAVAFDDPGPVETILAVAVAGAIASILFALLIVVFESVFMTLSGALYGASAGYLLAGGSQDSISPVPAVVGLLGAALGGYLAYRFYEYAIALVTGLVGAGVLALAVPIADADLSAAVPDLAAIWDPLVFVGAAAAGVLFQFLVYTDLTLGDLRAAPGRIAALPGRVAGLGSGGADSPAERDREA